MEHCSNTCRPSSQPNLSWSGTVVGLDLQVSEDYCANLAHNVSDAIALLPKLTTGIDVNLRFHDIRGFEVCRGREQG